MNNAQTPHECHAELSPLAGNAVQVREQAARARADLQRRTAEYREQIEGMNRELEEKRRALEAEFRRQSADLLAQMKPLQEELAKMSEVLWTVNLYLGRDEKLRLIRDGRPAPIETPITIRQKVLVMAEESLLMIGRDGESGMDYRNIDKFVEWLVREPANLDRILPEPKGVVVLIPTCVESRSGNPWEDTAKNAANKESYWLLRNGERLYLLTVDPQLRVTHRVLPRRSEFVEVFDQRLFGFGRGAGMPLQPGSEEWLELEKKADTRRRHYMRIMMVLQGVIDRTPVWHPLPPSGVNLLSVDAQADGKVRLIADDEDELLLTDGRESFEEFQSRLNAQLRPGLRVIGAWPSPFNLSEYDSTRYFPKNAEGLERDVPYLIEERRSGGLVIRFQRTDSVYKRNVPVPGKPGYVYAGDYPTQASRRASFLFYPRDRFVLPFDLISVSDLTYYLNHRGERSTSFLSMVPTLKAALAAKKEEAAQEAPFRVLLKDRLIAAGCATRTVDGTLDDLVHWWKVKNTWSRPLNGEPLHEGAALKQIVAEFQRRNGATDTTVTQLMIAAGRAVSGCIAVASNKRGQWFAYAPSDDEENVFLDVTPIHKDGTLAETRRWAKLQQRSVSAMTVAWKTDRWTTWQFSANQNHWLTGPERADVIDRLLADAVHPEAVLCVVELHDATRPESRTFARYEWAEGHPSTAEVFASRDSLDWRSRGELVAVYQHSVTKTHSGITVGRPTTHGGCPTSFSTYSSGKDTWGGTPWDDTARGGNRPRLVWGDENLLEAVFSWRKKCHAEWEAEREIERSQRALAGRYAEAVNRLIKAELTARARARFDEDYAGAEDLWGPHLASLRISSPVHPARLADTLARSIARGELIAGMTLGDVAQGKGADPAIDDWAHVVIPELPDEGSAEPHIPRRVGGPDREA